MAASPRSEVVTKGRLPAGADGGSSDEPRYLDLAREIQHEVDRVAADGSARPEDLDRIFDAVTERERARIVREVFDRLPVDEQWAVLERTFGDAELAGALVGAREDQLASARRREVRLALVATGDRLDTRSLPEGEQLTLGLFREADVASAIGRGARATNAARRLGLKATADPGALQVIEDVFNPGGGYFVTRDYDEVTWRDHDRLPAHALVRVGSLVGADLDPALHLGGRVDIELEGRAREGRLHLGFALVGDVDLFSGPVG